IAEICFIFFAFFQGGMLIKLGFLFVIKRRMLRVYFYFIQTNHSIASANKLKSHKVIKQFYQ
ncbi:MAG: hypothetical protein ACFBSE_18980, partial [Prochloraceae cyanobacterium]